jgi:hypothetical protein
LAPWITFSARCEWRKTRGISNNSAIMDGANLFTKPLLYP